MSGASDARLSTADVQSLRKALEETQLLLDTIIDALPVGVFVKDMANEGRYVIYNTALCAIEGQEVERVLGKKSNEVYGPVDGTKFNGQDLSVMAGDGQDGIYEETIVRPTGDVLRVRSVKKPLPTSDGSKPRFLLGICEDVTARRASEDRLAHMALHDALTGLPNRLLLKERLDRDVKRRHAADTVSILYIDLDVFKAINDTYGHHVGDRLLEQVAVRLRSCLRPSDMVARLGGDEFAVLTHLENGEPSALRLAERLLQTFEQPFDLGDCVVHMGASIGISIASDQGEDGEALLRYADIALYAAKSEGRGVARVHVHGMTNHAEHRLTMSEDLRRALTNDEFEIDYQPLHDLATERVTGFEALLRWRHPTRGLVSPADFIPYAEQTGLIVAIGQWVLRAACQQAVGWPEDISIAVNLSAVQFKKPGLVAWIRDMLHDTGLSPRRLELEVTESILLLDSGSNVQTLYNLRALGVRIAMDDFGTGYSSLNYLRRFPFDKIKMDRSFIADVCDDLGSLAIVRAVTGLGSSLSITTTAEGIETPEQFATLKAEGFNQLQGFLIGRPMKPDRVMALLASQAPPQQHAMV